jgi:hypothetical protein
MGIVRTPFATAPTGLIRLTRWNGDDYDDQRVETSLEMISDPDSSVNQPPPGDLDASRIRGLDRSERVSVQRHEGLSRATKEPV